MADSCPGRAAKPNWVRIVDVNDVEPLTTENPSRRKIFIENRGPGTVFISPLDQPSQNRGIRLLNGDAFVDEWPFNHVFEWYATADVANTDIIITEWITA